MKTREELCDLSRTLTHKDISEIIRQKRLRQQDKKKRKAAATRTMANLVKSGVGRAS